MDQWRPGGNNHEDELLDTDRRTFAKAAAFAGIVTAGGIKQTAAAPAKTVQAQAPSGSSPVPLAPPDKQPPHVKLPEVIARKPGWAIVGLGELSIEEILPAFGLCTTARLAGLVSGHRDKADKLAAVYGVNAQSIYSYENFDDIAKNDDIDVIYIVLPNSMHAEYTIRALDAGKHVLCEKPMAVTTAECEKMIAAAERAKKMLGVAYRLHYEPLNMKAAELCKSGAIGKIKTIASSNCQNTPAPNIRLSGPLGGGPVGDVGVYSINAACWITGEQPSHVSAVAHWPKDDPRFREVPESVAFTLEFPSGVFAVCECGFGSATSRTLRVTGADGYVHLDPAFAYNGLSLSLRTGDDKKGEARLAELQIAQKNHFTEEMDGFSRAVLGQEKVRTPGKMGLADVKTVNAIMEAAKTGQRVEIG